MNKKFILIIAAFTITVPGFFLFSYWYLGIFSNFEIASAENFQVAFYGAEHSGDYNKTGEKVVQTKRLLKAHAVECLPVLVYRDNAITTGKPYLRSWGGCILSEKLPAYVVTDLAKNGMNRHEFSFARGYRLRTYAQTAVALRKAWTEIARLSEHGANLDFPLFHRVHEDGTSEFYIAVSGKGLATGK